VPGGLEGVELPSGPGLCGLLRLKHNPHVRSHNGLLKFDDGIQIRPVYPTEVKRRAALVSGTDIDVQMFSKRATCAAS